MVSVELHVFAQILTVFFSAANALYYMYIYQCTNRGHLMKWEVAWVAFVETINYIIQIATGSVQVELASGTKFPWMRYVGWQLTCPVLLTFIVLNMLDNPTTRLVVQLLMNLQFIILSGMTASLIPDMNLKVLFVLMASAGLLVLYYCLYTRRKNKHVPMSHNKELHLLLYFMASWLCFPAMFILGPEMTDVIPFKLTLVGHCIGDLVSKNVFGILAWQYTMHMHKHETKNKNMPEADEVESIHSAKVQENSPQNKKVKDAKPSPTHVTIPLDMFPMFMPNMYRSPGKSKDDGDSASDSSTSTDNSQHSQQPLNTQTLNGHTLPPRHLQYPATPQRAHHHVRPVGPPQ